MSVFAILCTAVMELEFVATFLILHWSFYQLFQWLQRSTIYNGPKREQFVNDSVSLLHAVVVSLASILQFVVDSAATRVLYAYAAMFSCTYFSFHAFHCLQPCSFQDRVLMVHHCVAFVACLPMTNYRAWYLQNECGQLIYFTAANLHLVEISAVFLSVRSIAKLFQNACLFLVSSISLLLTYLPSRCLWLAYSMYVTWRCKQSYLDCVGISVYYFAIAVQCCIWLISAGYSVILYSAGKKAIFLQQK